MPNMHQDFTLDQLGPFLSENTGRGSLRIQATTKRGLSPVSNAEVTVSAVLDGTLLSIYRRKTNSSGIISGLILPAKPRAVSQRQSTALDSATLYAVSVTHPNYLPLEDKQVVVFDGVETIFPALLEPALR